MSTTEAITDDDIATAYKADLHARCTFYRLTSRFRECAWTPSGVCTNCGREQPDIAQLAKRMEREHHANTPTLRRLAELADVLDKLADSYAGWPGSHNAMLHHEARRASEQLRAARQLVIDGVYTQTHGVLWIRAAVRIITAHQRGRR